MSFNLLAAELKTKEARVHLVNYEQALLGGSAVRNYTQSVSREATGTDIQAIVISSLGKKCKYCKGKRERERERLRATSM